MVKIPFIANTIFGIAMGYNLSQGYSLSKNIRVQGLLTISPKYAISNCFTKVLHTCDGVDETAFCVRGGGVREAGAGAEGEVAGVRGGEVRWHQPPPLQAREAGLAVHRLFWLQVPGPVVPLLLGVELLLLRGPPALAVHHPVAPEASDGEDLGVPGEGAVVPASPLEQGQGPPSRHRAKLHGYQGQCEGVTQTRSQY